jgi:hypothetical protein
LKKAKNSSNKEVTAEVEGPTLLEGALVAPSPPNRALKKGKEAPSVVASPSSTPEGHVSVVTFFSFLLTMVLIQAAPEPTFGC